MPGRTMLCLGVTMMLLVPDPARAQHGHGAGRHHPGGAQPGLAAVGGYPGYLLPYYVVAAPGGGYTYVPTFMMVGPAGFIPPFGSMVPPPVPMRGPLLPSPPPQLAAQWPKGDVKPAAPKSDPGRGAQLITLGDRHFRAGNLKKAEERYQQAARALSDQAAPYLRLTQIALTRGNYTAAANRLREAETAQPGWIVTAPDIQAIYGEPTEFAHQIARLESYVQSHPDDRDAWLVLGAQWFLTGRTARAADVFLRLNDPNRKPDVALNAFLDASNQPRTKADDGQGGTR
jgi:hypothetical protein